MYPLSARNDFFSTAEHIVRIREFRVGGIRHGVERANFKGKFVKYVCQLLDSDRVDLTEISLVFLLDKFAQEFFLRCSDQIRCSFHVEYTPCRHNHQ